MPTGGCSRPRPANSQLRPNPGRVEASLDALPAGLVLCDRNGRVVAQNTAATQFLQARHGEALVARVIKDLLEQARFGERVTTRVELHVEPRRSYEVTAVPSSARVRCWAPSRWCTTSPSTTASSP